MTRQNFFSIDNSNKKCNASKKESKDKWHKEKVSGFFSWDLSKSIVAMAVWGL